MRRPRCHQRAGHQHKVGDGPTEKNRDGHDECHGGAHSHGHVNIPRHADKGADAYEIVKDEVIDQRSRDGNKENV